ncbi:MAG: hypothetical protein F6K40_06465 [Okeania sp. SIO3I5]|uniref:hypothetical protein n=1 Tax=Okeania sp. SIO3I5 TaxID=2607805 RepID=UPI0013B85031|nr:hypothetical protein [Okeania sp. SIO3I5]NEQ35948.1 hypothetical protein [Okeania sp. SIO3I5]
MWGVGGEVKVLVVVLRNGRECVGGVGSWFVWEVGSCGSCGKKLQNLCIFAIPQQDYQSILNQY